MALAAALFIAPFAAHADSFHMLVGYQCSPVKNQIQVYYKGAYNDAGEEMVAHKTKDEWNPWDLVTIQDDGKRTQIVGIETVNKMCKLRDGVYNVTIRPVPGNYNIQGNCGAFMSAGVRIKRAERTIIDTNFEGSCQVNDLGPVITKVIVSAGSDSAAITKASQKEFYK